MSSTCREKWEGIIFSACRKGEMIISKRNNVILFKVNIVVETGTS